ncbi:protein SLOW WALKER 1-like [Humulus lupulus]|uniref:protein SLOW WALKER 1-like n=1 Tax=Humulus lupulus TaxID=3486 RepID=UPI002B406234|nr:protein SLOW WALKER 1-like [Humulus lupulus]
MEEHQLSKTFPVKPKLKPKPRTQKQTPQSKYWSSFKSQQIPNPKMEHEQHLRLAVTHSASLSIFSSQTFSTTTTISSFSYVVTSASFRCDGLLIAASNLSGLVQVFDIKGRTPLRKLRSHTRPVRFVQYPIADKLHLVSGGDDALVKYWDVAGETPISEMRGHKDYVRCGDCSPVSSEMFITGSYDHTVKLWDVRVADSKSAISINHGNPVEDVIFLPSGRLVATAGGNSVKIWDIIGGGKMLCSMESHNKTVTLLCVGKMGKDSGEESQQYRIMSVGLDGYMKVFDYAKMKVTHSMRFPAPLMSVAFSPDCSTRVIGTSNGIIYAGKRKTKEAEEKKDLRGFMGFGTVEEPQVRALKSSYVRYFHRGQGEKPAEGDYLVMRPKKVKLAEHDKLLKKFRHKEALVSVLGSKHPDSVVAVMEELVARKKLLKCVLNLDSEELGSLLMFLQRYSTVPIYSALLMGLTKKVLELRSEDIKASGPLNGHIRNLKRSVDEEIRVQHSLLEIQGIISPLLRLAGRR